MIFSEAKNSANTPKQQQEKTKFQLLFLLTLSVNPIRPIILLEWHKRWGWGREFQRFCPLKQVQIWEDVCLVVEKFKVFLSTSYFLFGLLFF